MTAPIRIYNTRTRQVEALDPVEPGHVKLYVCGMTVYDDAHTGHARAFVVFDALVRYLRHQGLKVTYVRNFTDVDDKIIRRAAQLGESPQGLADRMVTAFQQDMLDLGLAQPEHEPRVTKTIPEIVKLIGTLVEQGHAYASSGTVWFSVPSFAAYGSLSNQQVAELRSEDPDPGKRHPADFALWKAAKPGEPHWDSPWGPGRPGWHIECSAMAEKTLGETVDIHGGGLDLVFPHHENEVAQSEAAHGHTFARIWMHNGLLTTPTGEKIGHSKGNFVTIRAMLAQYPAEALRLYYLQNHWRSPLPFDESALPDALGMLARLYEAREVAEKMSGSEPPDDVARSLGNDAMEALRLAREFPDALHQALSEDFNTSRALGLAFELARAMNRLSNHKKAGSRGGPIACAALGALKLLPETLGLLGLTTAQFQDEVKQKRLPLLGVSAAEVEAQVEARAEARRRKDWPEADRLRAWLEERSIVVMDRGDTSEWRVRL
jgi:cysteinyl-tRNA synthetase